MKVKRRIRLKRPIKLKRLIKFKRPIKVKRKGTVRRPNAALYLIAYTFIYPFLKICFKLKVDRSGLDLPDGAYIMLSNHYTMLDFLMVMLPLYPKRLNAVTAQKWFLSKPLNKMLPVMGCIPKNMFDPDVRSIIGIKTVLNKGNGLLMFPEGRCSSSHAYVGIHKSTGKMIKKFGVPVVTAYIEGAAICLPHWRKGFRCGRIRVTYKNLFSADETQSLTIDEINSGIDARLSGDEGALPVTKPFKTLNSKKLAEGLQYILYYCPKCKNEYTMVTKGNVISCNNCGNEATMGKDGNLILSQNSVGNSIISLWYKEQVEHEMQALSKDMEPIIEKVKVKTPSSVPGGGMEESGFGTIRLDPEGWHFDGEISGEKLSRFFPIETVPAMSYDHDDNFQIYCGGEFFMFIPKDLRKCLKYVILAEGTHIKFSPKILMTPGKNSGFY